VARTLTCWFDGRVPQALPAYQPPVTCHVVRDGPASPYFAKALTEVSPAMRGRAVVLTYLSQPAPVSPAVVEELVDLLLEGGCEEVVVAAALSTGERDRGHRSVETLANSRAPDIVRANQAAITA